MSVMKKETKLIFSNMDEDKLLQLALQNKSKKYSFTFQLMLIEMEEEEMDKMWLNLHQIVLKKLENIPEINAPHQKSPKKVILNLSKVIQAVIDIAQAVLEESMPLPKGFLLVILSLNGYLLLIPNLDGLKNNICFLCEKMFSLNYTESIELYLFNVVLYLLKRSTSPGATKKDVKRVYGLRTLLPKIIVMETVKNQNVWQLLENCAASNIYSTMVEGQKVISLVLTLDAEHVINIHDVIKKKLPSCSELEVSNYGRSYFEAFFYAAKSKLAELQDQLEVKCVYDFIMVAIRDKDEAKVLSARKILAQFHSETHDTDVCKLLHYFYYPILWRYLKHPEGWIRANSAHLFLDVFPLESPDLDVVQSDLALNEQMLLIKDLLLDDNPIVCCCAINGLCLAMKVHWELFPEDMRKTYFKILTDDLSCDSSSSEVRYAVAKGFNNLLENPLTVPTVKSVLPRLKLFDDSSSTVRIAFCELLMSAKKICGITNKMKRFVKKCTVSYGLARKKSAKKKTKNMKTKSKIQVSDEVAPSAFEETDYVLSMVPHMQSAFDEASSYSQYHPSKEYRWEFKDNEETEKVKEEPRSAFKRRRVDVLGDLGKIFPPKSTSPPQLATEETSTAAVKTEIKVEIKPETKAILTTASVTNTCASTVSSTASTTATVATAITAVTTFTPAPSLPPPPVVRRTMKPPPKKKPKLHKLLNDNKL